MNQPIGQLVKGYELCEQIGVGGYGAVYRARQPQVGREVAIKIIHPSFVNHPEFIRRFEAEAHLVARLEHPHIVPLYDYWREPDGAYLVMRWLRAGSLAAALENGPLPFETVARVVEQVAAALTVAHRRGVVHRDLKPANILLDEDGNAYLADFGIAKDLATATSSAHTQAQLFGSPDYMSPEQINHATVTTRSDIYSLGISLYEMLTGQVPFPDLPLLALLYKHTNDPVPSVRVLRPDAPGALDHIVQRATAKAPADRYGDVLSLARDLRMTVALTRAHADRADGGRSGGTYPGVGPGQRTARYETLRLDDAELDLLDMAAPPMENPYKGLRPFEEADAGDFFGRAALISRLLSRLAEPLPESRFLAVVGPSGSGKSSVVKAGVLPALRQGALPGSSRWFIVEMVPGADPLAELEAALLRVAVKPVAQLRQQLAADSQGLGNVVRQILPENHDTELVLVIDQFEEVFTRVADETERMHFLATLWAAVTEPASRIRVILTMRADFYDRPLLYQPFCELLRERTEVVTALSPDELRDAILLPAERAGLRLDEGLVDAIVHDVGLQPGALPMLQYALTELFERRVGRTLTLSPYHAAGGVVGALARRAEEIYLSLDSPQREAAQQLFLRLVTLGEGTEDTRRRVQRGEVAAVAGDERTMDSVIDHYCSYRLLTTDSDRVTRAPTVEVAHEALIRSWDRLRDWLATSRDDLRVQRRLEGAATEWLAAERDPSFLARGARLEQFASWSAETHLALNDEERSFLDASLAERDAEAARVAARQAREQALEQRSRRVLRGLLAVSVVAAIVGIGLAGFAFVQRREAQAQASAATAAEHKAQEQATVADQARVSAEQAEAKAAENARRAEQEAARAQEQEAEARKQAITSGAQAALSRGNPDQALALALAGMAQPGPLPATELTLSEAAYAPGTRRVLEGHTDYVNGVAFSPDGRRALTGGRDNRMILWDLATGAQIQVFEGHAEAIRQVRFVDASRAVSASEDGTLILWDLAAGKPIGAPWTGHQGEIKGLAVSPDGSRVYSAAADALVIAWDVATGQPVGAPWPGHTQPINLISLSRDGTQLVSTSQDGKVILWDTGTGTVVRELCCHDGEARAAAISPDGQRIVSGGDDHALIVWDAATGAKLQVLQGHSQAIYDVVFSPDGALLATGSVDNTVRLWDAVGGTQLGLPLAGHRGQVRDIEFSPSGQQLLSGSQDVTTRLWDLRFGALLHALQQEGSGEATVAVYSPDGRFIFDGAEDRSGRVWDATTGAFVRRDAFHSQPIGALAFSRDGKYAASGGSEGDGYIVLYEAATGRFVRRFAEQSPSVNAILFLPDGKHMLSSSSGLDPDQREDNPTLKPFTLSLWDIATGARIGTFGDWEEGVHSMALSPDGLRVLTAIGSDVVEWDIASQRQLQTFQNGHIGRVNWVAYGPDGTFALSAAQGKERQLIRWDLATGAGAAFEPQPTEIRAIAISPDGRYAVSGSGDNLVTLWDLVTLQAIRNFSGHTGLVESVQFSPDGTRIVSASRDGSVRVWRVDTVDELKAWATTNRYVPALTCTQIELYKLEGACATGAGGEAPTE